MNGVLWLTRMNDYNVTWTLNNDNNLAGLENYCGDRRE